MHIAFLNPQGNFDRKDSYWTEHPDFGGQLVYVKNVALAMAKLGHWVDILTRRIDDPSWPEFAAQLDSYHDSPNVRIVRLDCGDDARFLSKEELWPFLVRDWVPHILSFYRDDGAFPDAFTGHYGDGGLAGALIEEATSIPFTFTAHSLGAQKMDKLGVSETTIDGLDAHYHFGRRLVAERIAMNRSAFNITSTSQEHTEQYGHSAYRGAVDLHTASRFTIIPPGVNLEIFDMESRSSREDEIAAHVEAMLERDLDAPERPAIVASSRLDPKKHHVGLVEAYASDVVLQDQANLAIATGGLEDPLRDDGAASDAEREVLGHLRTIIDRAGLQGKVSAFALRGQEALAAAYRHLARRRSVFALTSLYEPFGLAPLEAAAAGLPVVVTRNGGPSESLVEGDEEYGVLVDPEDPGEVARGLRRALGAEWEQLHVAGRQRVLDRYTWERTAEAYLHEIAGAIDEPARRRAPDLLPIHPYFRDPSPMTDVTSSELRDLYFQ